MEQHINMKKQERKPLLRWLLGLLLTEPLDPSLRSGPRFNAKEIYEWRSFVAYNFYIRNMSVSNIQSILKVRRPNQVRTLIEKGKQLGFVMDIRLED